jgi:hypothetical protein
LFKKEGLVWNSLPCCYDCINILLFFTLSYRISWCWWTYIFSDCSFISLYHAIIYLFCHCLLPWLHCILNACLSIFRIDCCIGSHNHCSFIITMALFLFCGFYGFHLTMTTVCTPEMYLGWFLFPSDCRFLYIDFQYVTTHLVTFHQYLTIFNEYSNQYWQFYEQLWKESYHSDGQQFHQYQQNKQSPLTSIHWI